MAKKLLLAIFLGVAVGFALGPRAEFLGDIGSLFVKLLKVLATPLIFFAIADSFHRYDIKGKSGVILVAVSTLNASVAILIAITISKLIPLKDLVDLTSVKAALSGGQVDQPAPVIPHISFLSFAQSLIPKSIFDPFLSNEIITVALMALFISLAVKRLKTQNQPAVETAINFLHSGLLITTSLLERIVKIIPLAVFGIIAKVVGTTGFSIFAALGAFVAIVSLGIFIHIVVYYSLLLILIVRTSPLKFYKHGIEAFLTAFTTGSSLATLPVTLKVLDEKMKVSKTSSRLAACVGTNLNHDGIILYEAVAALFIAQSSGITLTTGQQIQLALNSVLAAVGIAGIPEAGLITLSVVLTAVGLPLSSVPLLLPVDWFIGRLRALANVTSDMIVALVLHKSEAKKVTF